MKTKINIISFKQSNKYIEITASKLFEFKISATNPPRGRKSKSYNYNLENSQI